MANPNKPFGFRLVGMLGSSAVNAQIQKFYTNDSTVFYVGDTVKLTGTAGHINADDAYYPAIQKAADDNVVLGVVVGFEPLPTNITLRYHTASTAQYVFVCTDPMAIYEVQGDSTVWAVTDIGTNASITVSTGSTTTGISNAVMTNPGADATNSLQIIGFAQEPDNEIGAYSRFLVKMNLNQYANAATGI